LERSKLLHTGEETKLDLDTAFLAITKDRDIDVRIRSVSCDFASKIPRVRNWLAIDLQNNVADFHLGSGRRSTFGQVRDHGASGFVETNALSQIVRHILNGDAKPATRNSLMLSELFNDICCKGCGNSESDTDIAAARAEDCRIDANHLTFKIEGRAT